MIYERYPPPSLIEEEETFSSVQASEINKYDSQIVQNEITITKIKLPYTQKVIMSTNLASLSSWF